MTSLQVAPSIVKLSLKHAQGCGPQQNLHAVDVPYKVLLQP